LPALPTGRQAAGRDFVMHMLSRKYVVILTHFCFIEGFLSIFIKYISFPEQFLNKKSAANRNYAGLFILNIEW